jgi:hypothetical protein
MRWEQGRTVKVCDEDPAGGYALAYDGAGPSANSTGCGLAGTTRSTRRQTRHSADVREDQAHADSLIGIAIRLLDEMSPF